ncbi:MAG: polyprenol monophosphomannose synthase [Bacteroidota bacterium]|nr:polyprenol monophosphomannose synthase [Bacteroidota bacterium]
MSDSLVIIPTYNEKENIAAMVQAVLSLPENFDLLIVDDGSPDGTSDIVKSLQQQFNNRLFIIERKGKLGLGTAYIAGFKYALARNYTFIFEIDADFSHNPKDLSRLYAACASDSYDVAIGSRYADGLVNVVNWPIQRLLLSYFASHYVTFITGMPIADPTGGFICYHRKVLENIILDDIRFVGYGFQVEMKFNAWKYGFKIKEVPIIFTDRTLGESKMSKSIIWEAIFGIIKLKVYSFFVSYQRSGNS